MFSRGAKLLAIAALALSVSVAADAAPPGPQTRHQLREAVLPLAVVGQPYSYQFETTLRDPAPTFSIATGQLPPGISLSSAGLLAGVPAGDGTYRFTVAASNGTGKETSQELTLIATGPPLLTLSTARAITSTTADLSASLNPRNLSTNAWFEYWPAANPANIDYTGVQTLGPGANAIEMTAQIRGLKPATDYLFRATASNDVSPKGVFTDPIGLTTPLPPPTAGKSFNIEPVDGTVSTQCNGEGAFSKLVKPKQVTLDCQIDAEEGTVSVTASKGSGKGTQTAQFWGGVFDIDQDAGDNRDAVMTLAGQLRCEKRANGMGGAQKRSRKGSGGRKLWGSGSGDYKTVGSHGAATVRGTIWLVADRCDGSTLFKVKRGTVVVRDFIKQSSVVLDAGQSYVAKVAIGRLP